MIFVGILFPCLKNKNWRYNYACHLFCDKPGNLAELHDFAMRIGLKRQWFQNHSVMPHYDLTAAKKIHAIRRGAIEVDRQTEVKWIRQWRRVKRFNATKISNENLLAKTGKIKIYKSERKYNGEI